MKIKICSICLLEKATSEYEKYSRKCFSCHHLTKCNTCLEIKENSQFRKSCPNKCKKCDNKRSYDMKRLNPSEAFITKNRRSQEKIKAKRPKRPKPLISKEESLVRLKLRRSVHRIFKRWGIGKFKDSYSYLGFTKEEFIKKFPEIPDGVEIDHKIPMSWFKRETPICIVFHIENLQLLPKKENREKSNLRCCPVPEEFMNLALPYIRDEFLNKF